LWSGSPEPLDGSGEPSYVKRGIAPVVNRLSAAVGSMTDLIRDAAPAAISAWAIVGGLLVSLIGSIPTILIAVATRRDKATGKWQSVYSFQSTIFDG
jgi:hypothetical protein